MACPKPAGSESDGNASGSGMITVKDGTQIFYKDWGTGQPLVFHHGMCTTHADVINKDLLSFIKG